MPITYPLSLPTVLGPASITIRPRDIVAVTRSPFTGQQQAQEHPGKFWEFGVVLPAMNRDDAEVWVAFLTKLNGRRGTFTMGDPMGAIPRGAASSSPGTPVVDGASQAGHDLVVRGGPLSVTDWLKAGDWIEVASGSDKRLYKVLDDASTDGAGGVTLTIWPTIRQDSAAPADGATVVLTNTVGLWRLTDNAPWEITTVVYGIAFSAMEAL